MNSIADETIRITYVKISENVIDEYDGVKLLLIKGLNNNTESKSIYVEEFENEFAKFHGRKYGLMTPNCTTALHLILHSLGIKKGDRVITIGGIHGKVIQVKNNKVVLRVSNNSEITVDTVAISQLSNLNKKESDGS